MTFLLPRVQPIDMKTAFVNSTTKNFKLSPETFLLVGDIGHFGFREIWESPAHAKRYLNIGILEQSMIGFAAGLARAGFYPMIHTITPFLIERPFEQIKVDFSLNELKGCFISVGASFDYSTLGPTHHSYADVGLFSSLYNTHVYSVASFYELDLALSASINNKELSYIRLNRNVHNFSLQSNTSCPFIYHLHSGSGLTIVSSGGRTSDTAEVIASLPNEISSLIDFFHVTKIHPITISPIYDSLQRTNTLLVIEDHSSIGSLYSQILTSLPSPLHFTHATLSLDAELIRGYGSYNELASKLSVSPSSIRSSIIQLLS